MNTEKHFVHDALAVHAPVHRLSYSELAHRGLLHVELEPVGGALSAELDECEALLAFQPREIGLRHVVDVEALTGFGRRRSSAREWHAAEPPGVDVPRRMMLPT